LRIEPYIIARLSATAFAVYSDEIKKVIENINGFLGLLAQSYEDLNETRISELQLIELRQ
jgi:hypothetical protein